MLAVYTPAQAVELFNVPVGLPVLVLMPVREVQRVDELYRGLICGKLHLTVHDADQLNDLVRLAEQFGAAIPLHLEVDTGMSRGGCLVADAPRLIERITSHRRLRLAGLFTHFANAEADEAFTNEQHSLFNELIDQHSKIIPQDCLIHAANTFATARSKRFHHRMVRVGLAWAGYCTEEMSGEEIITEARNLEPCITWSSQIVQIKRIAAGTPVGYGSRWRADRDSLIGLVPVGYADGYPISAGTRSDASSATKRTSRRKSTEAPSSSSEPCAWVSVVVESPRGKFVKVAPVVGAVNMDQITIDLTHIAESLESSVSDMIGVGTRVELISSDPSSPNHLPRLAESCGTFAHEMLCRLNPRLKRVYKTVSASALKPVNAPALA
jgi:alanine racemase